MSDPKEPVPSRPPAEPIDVRVNPDSPPREPFDVPITLSRPPAEPFDVPIFPDAPPREPIDVPISLDGSPRIPVDVTVSPDLPPREPIDVPVTPSAAPRGTFDVATDPGDPPREPFDVSVAPDAPPAAPFDVPTSPDAPPRPPIDVPVSLDGPPAAPFDVSTAPDAPPRAPFDVQVTPDAPPAAPFDVAVSASPPPRAPFDVPTVPSRPPAAPFDVPVTPSPPALQIDGRPGSAPTIDAIVNAVIRFDHGLGTFLAGLVDISPVHVNGPGGGALDPANLARWLRDYVSAVGPAGIAKFIAEQTMLHSMNPVVARVFDPMYFLKMSIPGSMGNVTTTLDVQSGLTMQRVAEARDILLEATVNANPNRPGPGRPDVYGPENKYSDGQAYSVDSIVDAAIDGASALVDSPFMKTEGGVMRFDATAFFEPRTAAGAQHARANAKARAAGALENVSTSKLAASNALDGVIRVGMPGEEVDGSVLSQTQDPSEVVDDDDARVPLSFTDLRQVPGKRFRSVYFRPTNLQFSEAISPEFSEQTTFGRVDPVVGYQRTTRTVNVSFEVHAFAPEDLERMYNKMIWLKSMCYPSYGVDSLIESGPVVRMRIGDVIGTDLGGVPGVIRGLNFDFAEAMWELKRGMKVPKAFKVSLDFLVLHDGPVGTVNGVFGVFQLPAGGQRPDKDTNFAGNPGDSRTEQAEGVTALPGRFARFGEPRS